MVSVGVGGEFSYEGGAAKDGDVCALPDDVACMSGPAQTNANAIGRDVQIARPFAHGVAAYEHRFGQQPVSGTGFGGGMEGLGGSGPA